jgi:hypothetical protein
MRLSPRPIDDANARAVTWLTAWDSQGSHRTGTTGDDAGARWLENEAAALGAEVANEVFTLDRLDPVACYLELDGERIWAVPAFDAPATGADGVTGTLALATTTRPFSWPSYRPDRSTRGDSTGCVATPLIALW